METENSMIDFKQLMNTSEYDFLRTEKRLGNRIILLGLGGSYAYGTCNENSDIDFRGITLNMPSDLIGLTEFEQYEDANTDTVIYSFNKIVRLLLDCNPNTCEILGLDEDQYLIKTGPGTAGSQGDLFIQTGGQVLWGICGSAAETASERHCQGLHAPDRKGAAHPSVGEKCPGGF